MSKLTDQLGSRTPKVLSLPEGVQCPEKSVEWACQMIMKNSRAALLLMAPVDNAAANGGIKVADPNNPRNAVIFVNEILHNNPVHGRLILFSFSSVSKQMIADTNWATELFQNHFEEGIKKISPIGYNCAGSMWLSAGKHRYSAHIDPTDGFLVHVSGKKQVKIWPVAEGHYKKAIFSFAENKNVKHLEPQVFDLKPGDILFIPAGALHEVVADERAVSIGYHMGSTYPLIKVCNELNEVLGRDEISVPQEMTGIDKEKAFYFDLRQCIDEPIKPGEKPGLPEKLSTALLETLDLGSLGEKEAEELLSTWWNKIITKPTYESPMLV